MIRQTSIDTYKQIKDEGLLSRRRMQVYEVLFKHGPLTGGQVAAKVKALYGQWGHSETIRNRITELRDLGTVSEIKTVACPITGRNSILWDVTKNLPKQLPKPTQIKCPHCKGKGLIQQMRLL